MILKPIKIYVIRLYNSCQNVRVTFSDQMTANINCYSVIIHEIVDSTHM